MGLVFVPLTVVHIAVGVALLTHAVHHSVLELANVLALVWPRHFAHTARLIFLELTFVDLAGVREIVLARAVEHAVDEFAGVCASFARECTLACFLAIDEVALVLYFIIVPIFSAFAVLLVLFPVALVEAALGVAESTYSMSHAITPLSLVNVAIGVRHAAESFKFAIESLTLVHCAVWILNCANATPFLSPSCLVIMGFRFQPLAKILSLLANVFPIVVPDEAALL